VPPMSDGFAPPRTAPRSRSTTAASRDVNLTPSIARELAPRGHPRRLGRAGSDRDPIDRDVLDEPEEEIPLGRRGKVDDVAKAIAWVASGQAGYVTGTTRWDELYPKFV
jgi:NAD(P)-dependent dehydrogenase (short-subunit alcohol dehydrogenase family)